MSSASNRNAKDLKSLDKKLEEAVDANNSARRAQLEILRYHSKENAELELPGTIDNRSQFLAHLDLLRYRKENQQIEIVKHYLSELKNKATIQYDEQFLDAADSAVRDEADNELNTKTLEELSRAAKQMTTQLEMAIIKADNQLKEEQNLLAEVRYINSGSGSEKPPPQARLAALSKTRVELVRWIEEKLSFSNVDETTASRKFDEEQDSGLTDTEYRRRILEQYELYVATRKTLLSNLRSVTLPLLAVGNTAKESPKQRDELAEISARPIDVALPFIEAQMLSLSRAQQAKAMSAVYTSSELKKERAETLDVLARLSEESHLLPSYLPLPAAQSNTKARVSADEAYAYAEHWSSASDAARAEIMGLVQEHVESGKKMARNAEGALEDLENLLAVNKELLG